MDLSPSFRRKHCMLIAAFSWQGSRNLLRLFLLTRCIALAFSGRCRLRGNMDGWQPAQRDRTYDLNLALVSSFQGPSSLLLLLPVDAILVI